MVDMVADMKVDKVADMVAAMSCFNLVRELVAGVGLLGKKTFFNPKLTTCVPSKLCEFFS